MADLGAALRCTHLPLVARRSQERPQTATMTHDDATVAKMAEPFDPESETWGLCGDPYVWQALREHLSATDIPASVGEAISLLHAAFCEFVGHDLVSNTTSSVYQAQYAHGGMSNGMISLDTWRQRLMPLLAECARTLLAT